MFFSIYEYHILLSVIQKKIIRGQVGRVENKNFFHAGRVEVYVDSPPPLPTHTQPPPGP